jgi:bifunctional non-homologous end joining protein LigD
VDHTCRFRDIAAAISKLSARTLVLDGEVAIYDQQLRSRFDWLREPDPDAVATPPVLMAFDIMYQDGRDLTARPLCDRRARLEDVVAGSELVFRVRPLAPDGLEAWKQVIERGNEGYVAKDEGSNGGGSGRTLVVEPPRPEGSDCGCPAVLVCIGPRRHVLTTTRRVDLLRRNCGPTSPDERPAPRRESATVLYNTP